MDIKAKVAELLLPELMSEEPRRWYYISVANEEFLGGYFIKAHGPTDAWTILHKLGWYPANVGATTQTVGPVDDDMMDSRVPPAKRWRKLSKQEVEDIG